MATMNDDRACVVVDMGSHTTRAGLATNKSLTDNMDDIKASLLSSSSSSPPSSMASIPSHTFNTVLGRPRRGKGTTQRYNGIVRDTTLVGWSDEHLGSLDPAQCEWTLKSPIEYGICVNWDDWDYVMHHIYNIKLKVQPEHHPLLLSEPLRHPKANRERFPFIPFETYDAPSVAVVNHASLAVMGHGLTTSLVVTSSGGTTTVTGVMDGHVPHSSSWEYSTYQSNDYGGIAITNDLITKIGVSAPAPPPSPSSMATATITTPPALPFRILRHHIDMMKPTVAWVAPTADAFVAYTKQQYHHNDTKSPSSSSSSSSSSSPSYQLPDGRIIEWNASLLSCTELLFDVIRPPGEIDRPYYTSDDRRNIQDVFMAAIKRCDAEVGRVMARNILITGGNSLLKGFDQRLIHEVKLLCDKQLPFITPLLHYVPSNDRLNDVWRGGALLSELSTFKHWCIQRADYEEYGPQIVHRHCM